MILYMRRATAIFHNHCLAGFDNGFAPAQKHEILKISPPHFRSF